MTDTTRRIGPLLATFMVANNMIGSGFFLLPATLASYGTVTTLSWVVATLIAIILGGTYARIARDYPALESPDDYVRPSLGRDMGFLASTLYWISSWIGNNAVAVAAVGYAASAAGISLAGGDAALYGQIGLIWLVFGLNLLGPKPVAKFQSVALVFGLLPVAVVLVFGWGHFDAAMYSDSWNTTEAGWNTSGSGSEISSGTASWLTTQINRLPFVEMAQGDVSALFGALAPIFWAFIGLESSAMVAGVVKDPQKNVPRATLAGVALAGVVYIASSVLVMGIIPAETLAGSEAPFALVAGQIFGPWAAIAIAAAAALKATGTLAGWMLVTGESGARAAQRGFLPRVFGRLNANGAAGRGLLIVVCAMTGIAVLSISKTAGEQFGTLINMVVLLVVVAYASAALSLLFGRPGKVPTLGERALGLAALVACSPLVIFSDTTLILGAQAIAFVAWVAYRVVLSRRNAEAAAQA